MLARAKAFTLIELLIVVAIIAILAAIAVPNFLEAQTRSKVSRIVSDLRQQSIGIEAYAVDHNRYPREYSSTPKNAGWGDPPLDPGNPANENSVMGPWLSTPVAYVTRAMIDDIFNPQATAIRFRLLWYQNFNDRAENRDTGVGPTFSKPFTDLALDFYGGWRIGSVGPDGRFGVPGVVNSAQMPYDPTNGTISDGHIWRSQKRGENNMPTVGTPGLLGPH